MRRKTMTLFMSTTLALLAITVSGLAQAQTSKTDVVTFFNADGTPAAGDVVGKGKLKRSHEGVNLTVETTNLEPYGAYSIWWVIFNNPGACGDDGCTDGDFGNPEVDASVLNATGRSADADGNATFSAFLPAGQILTNPASGAVRHAFGPGLQNARGAEVHIVVRCHGPTTGNPEQISTLFADCLADDGDGGQVCFDAQAAVFPLPRSR